MVSTQFIERFENYCRQESIQDLVSKAKSVTSGTADQGRLDQIRNSYLENPDWEGHALLKVMCDRHPEVKKAIERVLSFPGHAHLV